MFNIRSAFQIDDQILRLLRLQDTSPTRTTITSYSVVMHHPRSGATSTRRVFKMNGTLYAYHPHEHPDAVVVDDGVSLTETEIRDDEELLNDRGKRWLSQKSRAKKV